MNDEVAFLLAIQENPDDATARLVYADWLEERGDIRSEYLRLEHQLAQIPLRLTQLRNQIDPKWIAKVSRTRTNARPIVAGQRFVDNRDNTVTDLKHNLMWIRDPGLLPMPIGEFRVAQQMDWITASRACEELQFAGFSDWRLPTVPEWEMLCDDIPNCSPEKYFDRCSWCWTSSESQRKPNEYYAAVACDDSIEKGFELMVSGPWRAITEWHVRPIRTVG